MMMDSRVIGLPSRMPRGGRSCGSPRAEHPVQRHQHARRRAPDVVALPGHGPVFAHDAAHLDAVALVVGTGEKSVTKNLREKRGVLTTNFVSPQSYYGVDFKWTPVYGKMTYLNRKITPFDLYFSSGAGITNTNPGG